MQDHPGKRLLLIIDQFEELYTLNSDKALQCRFIDRLLQPAQPQDQSPDFTMLTAIRADFMGQAVSYGPFAEVLNTYPVEILKQMDEKELRAAIEQPAQKMGVVIESGLTERILQDLGQAPGNLPLLEFALTQLWERQADRQLTHTAYTDIGGVSEALAHHADEVYGRFDAGQQENLRRVLVQLVRPGEGTEDTRQMATRNQIRAENWDLVIQLANARLVVTGRNEETGEKTAEVVHEALIQHWQPLREWMDADREFRMWQERLRSAMKQWHTSNHDEGALLRGAPLAEAGNWLEQHGKNLSQKEQQFIKISLQLRDRERVEREAQQQHELELLRKIAQEQRQRAEEKEKATRKLHTRLVFAIVLAVIAIAAFIGTFYGFREATRNAKLAKENEKLANEQKEEAIWNAKLAKENEKLANEQKEIAEQERNKAEVNAIEALNQTSKALFLTHDELGALLAGVKAGVKVKHTNAPTPSRSQTVANLLECIESIYEQNRFRLYGHMYGVERVAFSPDGTQLASGSWDGTIRLWEVATGHTLRTFPGHTRAVRSVAFSPDGTRLASGDMDATIKIWDVVAGTEFATLRGHTEDVWSVAFSPDGTRLASGSGDATIKIWDVVAGTEFATLRGHTEDVWSVAFSPDGTWLASGSEDATIKIWDVVAGTELATLRGHTRAVESVAFSPDGTRLASGDMGATIKIWDVVAGTEFATLRGHTGDVLSVAFSPDGTRLASGGLDSTIKIWDVAAGKEFATLRGHTEVVLSVAFSPDGTRLAFGSEDGTIRLWSLDLDDLLVRGCEWLHGYLKTNPNVSEEDRSLCDDILRNEPLEKKSARQAQKEFQSRMNWGKIYMAQGHYEKAITSYRKALEMHPYYDEDAWYNVFYALYKQGKLQEAHADFQKLLEIDPTHRFALSIMVNVGNDLKEEGKLDEALAAYQTLLEVEPGHEGTALNMVTIGVAFWKQGKLDEAGVAWETAAIARANQLKERPNDLNLLGNDAEVALLQNDIPRCQERITAAIPLVEPDNGLFAILRFFAWLADPEKENPQKVLTAISKLEPGVEFGWDLSDTEPAIALQNEETQQIAQYFMKFFEGEIDLPTLKARLAEYEKQE